MFENLLQAFVHQVARRPNELALLTIDGGGLLRFTWRELAGFVAGRAAYFAERFSQTDAPRYVGYAANNSFQDVLTALACMASAAIEFPMDARLGETAERMFHDRVGGHWIPDLPLKTSMQIESLRVASESIAVDQPSLVLWTSGTTARPKGVTLTHRNLCGNAQAKLSAVPQYDDDVRLTSLPLCHAYARTCDFGTWLLSGCTLAVGLGFDAWQALARHASPTIANVVPSLAKRLLKSDPAAVGCDRLRLLGCGGAAMNETDFLAWESRGVTVIQGYGLTEASPVICSATPEDAQPGFVGSFVDGWEHEIRDGQLFVRGEHVMHGYWNDERSTSERIHDGWLTTGDMVEQASSGQIKILGRADDMIVLPNGRKLHPQLIEREIEQIDAVDHAMVVFTQGSLAVWIDGDSNLVDQSTISQQLADRPAWQRPRAIHFFDPPLSQSSGELTAKGNIRRAAAIQRCQPRSDE